jgi:hypothetical protein
MTTRFRGSAKYWPTAAACVIATSALVAARSAVAQNSEGITIDVAECVEIASPDERFACYERRVDAARRGAAEPGTGAADRPPTAAQQEVSREEATPSAPRNADIDVRAASRNEPESRELVGMIASLRETVPNSYLITLENGQVWRQTTARAYPLQPGQQVRIYPTNWGDSFRLTSANSKGFIQVRRVR